MMAASPADSTGSMLPEVTINTLCCTSGSAASSTNRSVMTIAASLNVAAAVNRSTRTTGSRLRAAGSRSRRTSASSQKLGGIASVAVDRLVGCCDT
jgi:hypothetical protein